MEFAETPALSMQGIGKANGGRYGRVAIDGICHVQGDIVAEERFELNGIGVVHGKVSAHILQCSGKLKIEGSLYGNELNLDGLMTVQGPLQTRSCRVNGALKIHGDCSAEQFSAEGLVTVDGLLNADSIQIALQGPAKIENIGGESISIKQGKIGAWRKWLKGPLSKWAPMLEANSIEGDSIELSHSNAAVVRGDRVVIGPECRIGRVEYRTSLDIHPSSFVGEGVKSQ